MLIVLLWAYFGISLLICTFILFDDSEAKNHPTVGFNTIYVPIACFLWPLAILTAYLLDIRDEIIEQEIATGYYYTKKSY